MTSSRYIYIINSLLFLSVLFTYIFKNDLFLIISCVFILSILFILLSFYSSNLGKTFLYIVLIFLPFTDIQKEILPNIFIGVIDIIMIPMVLYSWIKWIYKNEIPIHKNYLLFIGFIFLYILAGLLSTDRFLISLRYLIYLIYGLAFLKTFIETIRTTDEVNEVYKILIIISFYPIIIGTLELILMRDITPLFKLGNSFIDFTRLSGPMAPNSFGYYFAFLLPFLILLYLRKKSKVLIVLILIYILFIFYSGSRSAFLFTFCTFFGLYVYNLYAQKKRYNMIFVIFGFILLILLVYIGYTLVIMRRSSGIDIVADYSAIQRIFLWDAAYQVFLSSPILGTGFGCFILYYGPYVNPLAAKLLFLSKNPHAHNLILNILAEMGIIGLIGSSLFIFYLLKNLLKSIKTEKNHQEKVEASILLIASISFLVSQQFDLLMAATSHSREIILTFLLIALVHRKIYLLRHS